MPKRELYEIKTTNFTEAIARLVDTFKQHNPSVGSFRCECLDGTKVVIKIANNSERVDRRARKEKKGREARYDLRTNKPDVHCNSTLDGSDGNSGAGVAARRVADVLV